jgi:hypothetical protein
MNIITKKVTEKIIVSQEYSTNWVVCETGKRLKRDSFETFLFKSFIWL